MGIAMLISGLALMLPRPGAAGTTPPPLIELSCRGAILGFNKPGDQRLAVYQDRHGHRLELWCTRRIFDSQFDLRVAMGVPAHTGSGGPNPAEPTPLATIGGCFFDNGDNLGPNITRTADGTFAKVEWITANPNHHRRYRFSYDFATRRVTITATVSGCPAVTLLVPPQPSYRAMNDLLPHPETQACALGAMGLNPSAPSP